MGDGRTAVHIASSQGNLAVLRVLLQNGGDAQQVDKEGETALHKACQKCHYNTVHELIQFIHGFIGNSSAFVNKCNRKGETALHYICMVNKNLLHYPDEDKQVVTLLLDSGVDVTLQTEQTKAGFDVNWYYVVRRNLIGRQKSVSAN